MGISESHIWAGFHLLDVEHSGQVSLPNFRKALVDIFQEYPDASHTSLLAKYCQEAFNTASGRPEVVRWAEMGLKCEVQLAGQHVWHGL